MLLEIQSKLFKHSKKGILYVNFEQQGNCNLLAALDKFISSECILKSIRRHDLPPLRKHLVSTIPIILFNWENCAHEAIFEASSRINCGMFPLRYKSSPPHIGVKSLGRKQKPGTIIIISTKFMVAHQQVY